MREFIEAPRKIYVEAKSEDRLIEDKTVEQIRQMALKQRGVIETQLGSIVAYSDPTSRSAMHTKDSIDYEFGDEERQLAEQAIEIMADHRVVSVDAVVGEYYQNITARFLIPEQYCQIAYGIKLLFAEPRENRVVEEPTYYFSFFTDDAFERNKRIRDVRKKDVAIRQWMGEKLGEQTEILRNTTYLGEAKKGVFKFENWRVKKIDGEGIFLHAGCRRDRLWIYNDATENFELTKKVTAVAGLTATGKTTTLCRKLARHPKETFEMIGDDGGTFFFNGGFLAFERNGIYVKTEELGRKEQPEIYKAVNSRDAYIENVSVRKYPYIPDFHDTHITRNGRSIVLRSNLGIASDGIRTDDIDHIIILTRNPLMNAVSRLTREQAVMQFIYGESIETSGGVEAEEGKFKRIFFLDPFVVGDRLEHAMIFYDYLKKNEHITYFLSNTGYLGPRENRIDITLRDSLAVYNDILRNQMRFSDVQDFLGYYYPIRCDRANLSRLVAFERYDDKELLKKKVKQFLNGRNEDLRDFEKKWGKIDDAIRDSLKHEFSEEDFDTTLKDINYEVEE